MAGASDSRIRIAFGVLNALAGLVVLVGVFLVAQPRYWVLDLPALLIGGAQLVSTIGLLAKRRWALRALAVAAWLSLVLGLMVVFAIVLSMVFLRSIHGDYGLAGLAVSGLIVALLVPYVVVVPVLELLWLGRQRSELAA
jgi:hypothetical protein